MVVYVKEVNEIANDVEKFKTFAVCTNDSLIKILCSLVLHIEFFFFIHISFIIKYCFVINGTLVFEGFYL